MNLNKVQYFIVLAVLELVFILLMIGFTFPDVLSYLKYILLGCILIASLQLNFYYSYKIAKSKILDEDLPDRKKIVATNIINGVFLCILFMLAVVFVMIDTYKEFNI